STSGFVFTLGGESIVWRSVKQICVADSTMEAEYVAASEAAKEAVWLRNFLLDLDVVSSFSAAITVFCDNSGALANSKEPRTHKASKHIERKYHLIREIVGRGEVVVAKIQLEDNLADPFTKSLLAEVFTRHVEGMGESVRSLGNGQHVVNQNMAKLELMIPDLAGQLERVNRHTRRSRTSRSTMAGTDSSTSSRDDNDERSRETRATRTTRHHGDRRAHGHRRHREKHASAKPKITMTTFEGVDPDAWLSRAVQFFEINEVHKSERVQIAAYYLDGEANTWWQWVSHVYKNKGEQIRWRDFEKELIARFGSIEYFDYDEALTRIRQTGSLRDYQKEFERIASRVRDWPEKALVGAPHNDALLIATQVSGYEVQRVFADTESSVNVIFYYCLKRMDLDIELAPLHTSLFGFNGSEVTPLGKTTLAVVLGEGDLRKVKMIIFVVVDVESAYNVILRRPTLNAFQAVVSTYHIKLKFP
ncbi:cysteine-rich RLK (RECEPTOR-like protein kinase) 8, partial [Striga hermonthica]